MPDLHPDLTLDPSKAYYILLKAREFDAKEEETDPDEGSNASDDKMVDVLEFQADDTVEEELSSAIRPLNVDERLDLIALIWIGRGDFTLAEWSEARDAARDIAPARTIRYIREIPLVSDYLEDALSQLGYSLDDYLDNHVTLPAAPEPATSAD
jgi:hypothetical protein